jgi:hypothetical protein
MIHAHQRVRSAINIKRICIHHEIISISSLRVLFLVHNFLGLRHCAVAEADERVLTPNLPSCSPRWPILFLLLCVLQVYAKREEMKKVIASATAGLPAKAMQLLKHVEARARSMPSLAAMKTTKLQDADCANKDVYEMILGKFTGLATNLTRDKVLNVSASRLIVLLGLCLCLCAWRRLMPRPPRTDKLSCDVPRCCLSRGSVYRHACWTACLHLPKVVAWIYS